MKVISENLLKNDDRVTIEEKKTRKMKEIAINVEKSTENDKNRVEKIMKRVTWKRVTWK